MKYILILLGVILLSIMTLGTSSLLKGSPSCNRDGTNEWEEPPPHKRKGLVLRINRDAYDSEGSGSGSEDDGDVVRSEAHTRAGWDTHTKVTASTTVATGDQRPNNAWLVGTYTISATLNHPWVDDKNKWDGRSDEWDRFLNEQAWTEDTDWWDYHNPKKAIEYCLADGMVKARDIRNRGQRWTSSTYIPW